MAELITQFGRDLLECLSSHKLGLSGLILNSKGHFEGPGRAGLDDTLFLSHGQHSLSFAMYLDPPGGRKKCGFPLWQLFLHMFATRM